ncbi:MAG: hypothetical protein QF464_17520, partial [Myxococcota bacterium]|nr:hypothetical protein [Myxococcota bacterium]
MRPGCCSTSEACDDTEACTTDACLSGPGGQCVNCPQSCPCPESAPLLDATFDGATINSEGFGIQDQQFDEVTWRLSSRRAVSEPSAAWIGHASCPTYYSGSLSADCQPSSAVQADGGSVRAELVSPSLSLPSSPGGHVATFWVWSDVEPLGDGGPGERDLLTVKVEDASTGVQWTMASSLWVGKHTEGGWRQMGVDLSPWTGATITLRLVFDTLDGHDNHHEGVYIDDLRVVARCKNGCCDVDADCVASTGSDPCTRMQCLELADGAGSACTPAPISPGHVCTACTSDDACADNNPCTEDRCDTDGVCVHDAFCCFESVIFTEGFEAGLFGWFVSDGQPNDGVTWLTSDAMATEGLGSVWFTDPSTGTYDTGAPVRAALDSPILMLDEPSNEQGDAQVAFWLMLSTEWDGQLYDNPAGLDRLSVEVFAAGDALEIWSSDEIGGSTEGAWQEVIIALPVDVSSSFQLRFVFDSLDGAANGFAGPRLDDLRV